MQAIADCKADPFKVFSIDFRVEPGVIVRARHADEWQRCRVDDLGPMGLLVTPIDADGAEAGDQFAAMWGQVELVPTWNNSQRHVSEWQGERYQFQKVDPRLSTPDFGGEPCT